MAANAGKHIHMEKPGGISLADFERLISVMKKTEKVFHIGYMYRYNPYIKELIENVKKGVLGEIISVEAQMNCIHLPEMRQWLDRLSGGMMFWLGCHLIDLIYTIQGKPKKIIPFNKCSNFGVSNTMDFGMASVAAITVIAYVIGLTVKASGINNKWIPILCALTEM